MKREEIEAAEKSFHPEDRFAVFATRRHGWVRLETEAEYEERKNTTTMPWKIKPRIGKTVSVIQLAYTSKNGRAVNVVDHKVWSGIARHDLALASITDFINREGLLSVAEYLTREHEAREERAQREIRARAERERAEKNNDRLRETCEDRLSAIVARPIRLSTEWAGNANVVISIKLLDEILTKLNAQQVWQ